MRTRLLARVTMIMVPLAAIVTVAPSTVASAQTGHVVRWTPAAEALAASGATAAPAGCAGGDPHAIHCYLKLTQAPAPTPDKTCSVSESGGYLPCNIQNAYGLTSLSATAGRGVTVAVVDAFDNSKAAEDLKKFRKTFGLPKCAKGCFEKLNQNGRTGPLPAKNNGWAQESALDIEMVSAVCPLCHIMLIEANSTGNGDLYSAVNEAVALGANVVSDSWGSDEYGGETGWDGDFVHPGIPITFSSGDGSYQAGVQYPSASPYVTTVGGTQLTPDTGNARGWDEAAWVVSGKTPPTQGSGSGCSAYEAKPAWQTDTGCTMRTTTDVSAVASDVIGYHAGHFYYEFGTSVSSPIIAAVYALADDSSATTTPASLAYGQPADLFDIASGSEGTCSPSYLCNAGTGYDGPTGLGTPDGVGAF
ncbi:MAG TPA: S53 family peptidase [Acidimicrobiales bacterium]